MANNLIVCGGTFDHFHKGHQGFLNYALSIGREVIVGLTSDEYIEESKNTKAQFPQSIESYKNRERSLRKFLSESKFKTKVTVQKIDDLFGSTLSKNKLIDAIVVSRETREGAQIINKKRGQMGMRELNILIAPLILAEDKGAMSSKRIRKGEIDRMGKLFINPLWLEKDLILPKELREELNKPFGEIVNEVRKSDNVFYVVTVGDETTKKFNKLCIKQNISVVDFKIARKKVFSSFFDLGFFQKETTATITNPAGRITNKLFSEILNIFNSGLEKNIILKIEGEEDLAVLPVILAAPLNTEIYYGQPGLGLVKVQVLESSKELAYDLASKFRPI